MRIFSFGGVFIFFLLAAFFLPLGCASRQPQAKSAEITFENGAKLTAEIAQTPEQLKYGLMGRQTLCPGCGMLFVFPGETSCGFWMKNTLIPLDIIFLSENKTVADIRENFAPCKSGECETYASRAPCAYAIESNAGFAGENKINAGMQAEIRWLG